MFNHAKNTATANEKLFYLVAVKSLSDNGDPFKIAETLKAIDHLVKEQGGDENYIGPVSGNSLLGHAIHDGNMAVMMKLLSIGSNPNLVHPDGIPLIVHAISKNSKLVLPLLKNGVDLEIECLIDGRNLKTKEVVMTIANERGLEDIASAIEQSMGEESTSKYAIFDLQFVKKEYDREKSESRKHFLKLMLDSGNTREISIPNKREVLLPLYEKFPNFSKAIDYIYRQVGLNELSDKNAFCMAPLLLSGPPGIGKTRFVRAISDAIGVDFNMIGCGGISAGWVLGGSSTSWSEGKPGMVLTALRDGKNANPIVMLDEIDKLTGDSRFSGFGPLFALLEKQTATTFMDEAVTVPLNCSMVSWIATANYLDDIPKPILSRFSTIEIEAPTPEQMKDVVLSIYRDILDENNDTWGQRFSRDITDDVIALLSESTPREASKRIGDAFGVAAVSRDCDIYHIEPSDLESAFKMKRKFGF